MRRVLWHKPILLLLTAAWGACPQQGPVDPPSPTGPPVYGYEIEAALPHDDQAFTQGLLVEGDVFFESTGLYGQSRLREVEVATGHVIRERELDGTLFGEGLALVDDRLIQLTWRERRALVYDISTFEPLTEFSYASQGWGLTYDGERLIMSDGTARLQWRDPNTFELIGTLDVRDGTTPVTRLNELEWVNGEIFANVYYTDRIARIHPETGRVTGWIDLTGILPASQRTAATDVLNGIAYDAINDRLYVTGKCWPNVFRIRLVP